MMTEVELMDLRDKMNSMHRESLCKMLAVNEVPEAVVVRYFAIKKYLDKVDARLSSTDLFRIALDCGFNVESGKFDGYVTPIYVGESVDETSIVSGNANIALQENPDNYLDHATATGGTTDAVKPEVEEEKPVPQDILDAMAEHEDKIEAAEAENAEEIVEEAEKEDLSVGTKVRYFDSEAGEIITGVIEKVSEERDNVIYSVVSDDGMSECELTEDKIEEI